MDKNDFSKSSQNNDFVLEISIFTDKKRFFKMILINAEMLMFLEICTRIHFFKMISKNVVLILVGMFMYLFKRNVLFSRNVDIFEFIGNKKDFLKNFDFFANKGKKRKTFSFLFFPFLWNVDIYVYRGYSELGEHSKTLTCCGELCKLIFSDLWGKIFFKGI